jgi:hypothetical protein
MSTMLLISLNASCRLAIFFSVESFERRKMLYMNVSIFKWICPSIGIKPEMMYDTASATFWGSDNICFNSCLAGFHGNNGLDPSTSIHILKRYAIPTITYGLEVLIPDKKNITRLDCFFKQLLKHWYFVYGDSNNQYISGKSYFHISDFTSVNQLLLFISLNTSCRLAIFFSVEYSDRYTKHQWKKLLYEQVNSYWKNYMIETSKLYKSIDFLNTDVMIQ